MRSSLLAKDAILRRRYGKPQIYQIDVLLPNAELVLHADGVAGRWYYCVRSISNNEQKKQPGAGVNAPTGFRRGLHSPIDP
jgi:hypothetical protein